MRRTFLTILALSALAAVSGISGGVAGERRARGSRALSGWFNVTAENGWRGRRYMDGDQIFAEEFATTPSGRIDVWRFYRRGVLTSEERDLNTDGKVDLQTRWDPRNGLLASVLRDTARRGVNDLEIERTSHNRWEIREDRNLDGVTDRILHIAAPVDFWDRMEADLAGQQDVAAIVPREMWREMWSDDAYTGNITDYFRYGNNGVLTHYGRWNGRAIDWERVPADFVPPAATPVMPVAPPAPPHPAAPYPDQTFAQTQDPATGQPWTAPDETVRDPFDLSAGSADADPYYTPEPAAPAFEQPPAAARTPAYTLPADESSARSVPARMRPPGSVRSRRPRL